MITFRRRLVHYGIRFEPSHGTRQSLAVGDSHLLYGNEVVVDVGGSCFNQNGETRLIFDHHFSSSEFSFPSASAAVLHNAKAIHDTIRDCLSGNADEASTPVWIVTHQNPDFDALCASFLAEGIIDQKSDLRVPLDGWKNLGLNPRGWCAVEDTANDTRDRPKRIDWFQPELPPDEEHQWPVLLGAYASCVDNCRTIKCRRTEALHSVLYAAMKRRGPSFVTDGARILFRATMEAIKHDHLNPLYDSLFRKDSEFAPELRLLENEVETYHRDILKSRKSVVHIHQTKVGFNSLLGVIEGRMDGEGIPLLQEGNTQGKLKVRSEHLLPFFKKEDNRTIEADGLFIRDPECLLFKEWARDDHEASVLGQGFLFTAIAYSHGRPEGKLNQSDYYFSVDPEKLPGAHIYNVWTRLQCEEVASRRNLEEASITKEPRPGFRNRSRGFEPWFADPWFDGQNYKGTIVATPWLGTSIAESGKAPDLSDDRIARIVIEELEYSVFERSELEQVPFADVLDLPVLPNAGPKYSETAQVALHLAVTTALGKSCFRFVKIRLSEDVDLGVPGIASQIGRTLWPFLEPTGTVTVPADLEARHLTRSIDSVTIWNRRGIAVAGMPSADQYAEEMRNNLSRLSQISCAIHNLLDADMRSFANDLQEKELTLEQGEDILKDVVLLKLETIKPENRPLRNLLEAIKFDNIIEAVQALNQQMIGREEGKRASFLNLLLGLFALTFAFPSLLLTFFQVIPEPSKVEMATIPAVPFGCGVIAVLIVYVRYRSRFKMRKNTRSAGHVSAPQSR